MYKILVCGGRDFNDRQLLFDTLESIRKSKRHEEDNLEIISGMAKGADSLAVEYAKAFGLPLNKFFAEWEKYGKSAGYRRNTRMLVEGKPDLVVAFPGGKGTEMMIKIAKEAGIQTIIISKDT